MKKLLLHPCRWCGAHDRRKECQSECDREKDRHTERPPCSRRCQQEEENHERLMRVVLKEEKQVKRGGQR